MELQSEEAEIIREMRAAIDLLKEKLQEAEGGWRGMVVEFLSAAQDDGHWMHQVVKAERLSNPYIDEGKKSAT